MSDELMVVVRDALIDIAPEAENIIRAREKVVNDWCEKNGLTVAEITVEQIMEIRNLPEWKNAE